MTQPQRDRLAEVQAALLRALLTDADPPPGFADDRLRLAARILRDKRRRVVARLEPDVCAALGDRFPALFNDYAREHPKLAAAWAREDARAFLSWAKRATRRHWWHVLSRVGRPLR